METRAAAESAFFYFKPLSDQVQVFAGILARAWLFQVAEHLFTFGTQLFVTTTPLRQVFKAVVSCSTLPGSWDKPPAPSTNGNMAGPLRHHRQAPAHAFQQRQPQSFQQRRHPDIEGTHVFEAIFTKAQQGARPAEAEALDVRACPLRHGRAEPMMLTLGVGSLSLRANACNRCVALDRHQAPQGRR